MLSRSRTFKKIRIISKKNRTKNPYIWKIVLGIFVFFFCVPVCLWWLWFYKNIYQKLPSISKIEDISFSQTTTITDRNWKILYKLFDENRYYVWFDKISTNMINAIVATEDKNFWTNAWIDIPWMVRAWVEDIIHLEKKQWASTITQQLIKELLLSKEKTRTRKLKEIVLSVQLSSYIEGQIKNKYQNLSSKDSDRKVKEKILELYLNYIFLWNNSYWVEAASKTYFGTSAQNLDILQASILASIPKAPSKYNPYTNYSILMWDIDVTWPQDMTWNLFTGDLKKLIKKKIEENVNNSTFSFSKDVESFLKNLWDLWTFDLNYSGVDYKVEYTPWRKDVVLWRMYEMWYANQEQLKDAIIKWLHFQFKSSKVNLDAPHFVFWVIEQLKKDYWEDLLIKWWLTIKTTLDMDIQDIARNSIKDNYDYIQKKWANNSAMLYLDSNNWDVLSYVGSYDYNNTDIDWQVDLIQAPRQPWSTMKPLLYALWFMKNNFTIDTPIYDLPYKIGKDTPENVDGIFNWLMSIKTALAWSRNIPAIKMYFIVWEDKPFKTFLKKIWITSLSMSTYYWYPLAIGSWELKIFELAEAYTHLSAMGRPAKINPILEIRWPDNSIIYRKKPEQVEQVIPSWVAYMLWSILSNKSNMPAWWVSTFDYPWLKIATKSWTTNVKLKTWKKLPRDWWLVTYTPSKVAIFWAWNTKWEPLHADAYGWWLSSVASKTFYKKLKEFWKIEIEDVDPIEVKNVSISKISWKLVTSDTPAWLIINTLWYIKNLPVEYDWDIKKIQVDTTCNWKATAYTPQDKIAEWYVISPSTIMPLKQDLDSIINWWKEKWTAKMLESLKLPILAQEPTNECEVVALSWDNSQIKIDLLNPTSWKSITREFSLWYNIKSTENIVSVIVMLDDNKLESFTYNKNSIIDIKNIKIPGNIFTWNFKLKLIVKDAKWLENVKIIDVKLVETDKNPPYLVKDKTQYSQLENWNYKVDLFFNDDESVLVWWKIIKDSKIIKEFDWNFVSFEVENLDALTFEIKDKSENVAKWDIKLTP